MMDLIYNQSNLTPLVSLQTLIHSLPVVERDISELLPPLPVDGISESRVVGVQLRSVRQDLVGELVQVLDRLGEPRNGVCNSNGFVSNIAEQQLIY